MKKILLIAMAILILGIAVPVSAQGREFTGEQLYLRPGGPDYWPPGKPFYVLHGWGLVPKLPPPGMVGLFRFELELDGKLLKEDFRRTIPYPPDQPIWLDLDWVYNFPDGLTGDHTFTLHYYGPCVAFGGDEYCPPPYRNEVLEVETIEKVVHFAPEP